MKIHIFENYVFGNVPTTPHTDSRECSVHDILLVYAYNMNECLNHF